LWIVQQLREAFPFDSAPRFLIFDRDARYGLEVPAVVGESYSRTLVETAAAMLLIPKPAGVLANNKRSTSSS